MADAVDKVAHIEQMEPYKRIYTRFGEIVWFIDEEGFIFISFDPSMNGRAIELGGFAKETLKIKLSSEFPSIAGIIQNLLHRSEDGQMTGPDFQETLNRELSQAGYKNIEVTSQKSATNEG